MPVKFEIYRDGRRVTSFSPVAAVAMGPESVPVPGDVSVRDGVLMVERSDDAPIGVSLLWDAGPVGMYHLETPRLWPREKPYVLNVELARCRLMRLVQKQEDWNLFDFPKAEKLLQRFKEAQGVFTEALVLLDDGAAAARLADQALAMAIELSEELALFHAEILLGRRRGGNARASFGCRADCANHNQRYREILSGSFDYAIVPMSWKQMQPQETAFVTEEVDGWVDALSRRRMPIVAGPLINLNEVEVPEWMFIWENDFDTLREMAYEHVQRLVGRYRKSVALWNVCASLPTNASFPLSFEQIIELTRLLVTQVKTLLPNARTLVTIAQPFGEYHATTPTSVAPLLYAEMVAQAGINFDGFGLELQLGVPEPGMFMRDLFQVSCLLDRFSTMGRPVFLTAVGVPGRAAPDPQDRSGGKLDPARGGRWRRPWDADLQAEWLDAVYRVALSKPFVEGVAWSDLADVGPSLPGSGLLNDMLQPKPAFAKLQQMREKIRTSRPIAT